MIKRPEWPLLRLRCVCGHLNCPDCREVSFSILACCKCRARAIERLKELQKHQKTTGKDTGWVIILLQRIRWQSDTTWMWGRIQLILSRRLFLRHQRITLSALASTLGGIVRPICFAVLRLMTNSNLVGCSTGKSAAFAPFRILSTYQAPRWPLRYLSGLYESRASTDCSAEQPHAGSFFWIARALIFL